jgi:prepilin-type N-terminal cleavage/methylation domain-containing protein
MKGFSLIELLVTMSIASLLIGFITINLAKTQRTTSVTTAQETLLADLHTQQIKAMHGGDDNYGVHIESDKYILFHGSYNGTGDQTITMEGITLSSVPTAPTNIIFLAVSGETTAITITLTHPSGGEIKQITLNKYGVKTNN